MILMDTKTTIENLEKHGFKVSYFETKEKATEYISDSIKGKTVGIGGSATVEEIGLFDMISKENEVFWHWKDKAPEVRKKAVGSQIYISSANAVSQTGEIVNIDGNGNRISAMLFGHENVYIIVGTNKITEDLDSAIKRARNIAAPLNAKRMNAKTPCASSDEIKCFDCDSPGRLCRGMSIVERNMRGNAQTEVIIINEELGY